MATEQRLIDANAIETKIEKSFRKLIANQNKPDLAAALSYVGDLIIEAPTVNAVEVVRCKDCKHYELPDDGDFLGVCKNKMLPVSIGSEVYPEKDHFCSYGERRTDNG